MAFLTIFNPLLELWRVGLHLVHLCRSYDSAGLCSCDLKEDNFLEGEKQNKTLYDTSHRELITLDPT
jgi:hypothetical protein